MSPDIPPAPPEAEVIRLARKAADMTAQSAAEATRANDGKGISASYWLDVERGRGGRRGQQVPVRASDRALAAMARVVGVLPAQLTAAGREDAARVLEEILRRDIRPAPPPPPERPPVRAFATDDDEPGLEPFIQDVLRELYSAVGLKFGPGQRVPDLHELPELETRLAAMPGAKIFPEEPWFAELWDGREMTSEELYRTVARIRKMAAGRESPKVRRIGLRRTPARASRNGLISIGAANRISCW